LNFIFITIKILREFRFFNIESDTIESHRSRKKK